MGCVSRLMFSRGNGVAKDTDSLDLTDQQKTRLLMLALGPPAHSEPASEDEQRGDLLHDILRCSLPLAAKQKQGRDIATSGACQHLRSVVGPPIGELLQDPKTSVDLLTGIKQYAKAQGNRAASEQEKDVFLAVYFAAIAAALAHYGQHITEHADKDLPRFFASFGSVEWVPASLRELLQNVVSHCSQNKEEPAQ